MKIFTYQLNDSCSFYFLRKKKSIILQTNLIKIKTHFKVSRSVETYLEMGGTVAGEEDEQSSHSVQC